MQYLVRMISSEDGNLKNHCSTPINNMSTEIPLGFRVLCVSVNVLDLLSTFAPLQGLDYGGFTSILVLISDWHRGS